jgi:imidazolonepropionase-like amidohydrolase
LRAEPLLRAAVLDRAVALRGTVWTGGDAHPFDGVVLVGPEGRIDRMGPTGAVAVPAGVRVIGGARRWIGPGIVDAHVHLAFGAPEDALQGGVVGVRDLGSPLADAMRRRTSGRRPPAGWPSVAVAGPLLTAPGGYPSRSWGAAGFAAFMTSAAETRRIVHGLAQGGIDLVKVAVDRGAAGRWPLPAPELLREVVRAAHDAGLKVAAHALTVEAVERVLDAGVDELAHTPTERLPPRLVDRIAAAEIPVISTLQTFFAAGIGEAAAANAADLHRAGVRLVYGTDLGNDGTRAGVDERELSRLADAGLGRQGALRAATEGSAAIAGVGRTGLLEVGRPAAAVLLERDPTVEPGAWRRPRAVLCDGRLYQPEGAPSPSSVTRGRARRTRTGRARRARSSPRCSAGPSARSRRASRRTAWACPAGSARG